MRFIDGVHETLTAENQLLLNQNGSDWPFKIRISKYGFHSEGRMRCVRKETVRDVIGAPP